MVYAAYAAALSGLRTRIVSVVGEDFPIARLSNLEAAGVDLRNVYRRGPTSTRFALEYARNRARRLTLHSQAPPISMEDVPTEGEALLVLAPIADELTQSAFAGLCQRFRTVYLDPQGFCRSIEPHGTIAARRWNPPRNLPGLSLLKFSTAELASLRRYPKQALTAVIKRACNGGARDVILTMGAKGLVSLSRDGTRSRMPAFRTSTQQHQTGAGDVLLGSYAAKRMAGEEMTDALAYASAVASLHIEYNILNLKRIDHEMVERRACWILERTETRR